MLFIKEGGGMRLGIFVIMVFLFILIVPGNLYAQKSGLSKKEKRNYFAPEAGDNSRSGYSRSDDRNASISGLKPQIESPNFKLNSIGFLSGYISGSLDNQSDYRVFPLLVNFGFDIRRLAEKAGIKTKGVLEFEVEPFVGYVSGPDKNVEAGVSFLVKYGFSLNPKFMPYVRFGAGPMYLGLDTEEQAKSFNFVDSAAIGFSWLIKKDMSLDCEYRFRHISNAGFFKPNNGIDSQAVFTGFTYRFY
jgi:opacity protein-like surface antigen